MSEAQAKCFSSLDIVSNLFYFYHISEETEMMRVLFFVGKRRKVKRGSTQVAYAYLFYNLFVFNSSTSHCNERWEKYIDDI